MAPCPAVPSIEATEEKSLWHDSWQTVKCVEFVPSSNGIWLEYRNQLEIDGFSCWHLFFRKIVGVEGDRCMTGSFLNLMMYQCSICLLHFLEDSASVREWDTST